MMAPAIGNAVQFLSTAMPAVGNAVQFLLLHCLLVLVG